MYVTWSSSKDFLETCWHLAVGHHHRRRTSRCPHGLQFGKVKVSLADHMHASPGIHHKLSIVRVYAADITHSSESKWNVAFSFSLSLKKIGKIPCLAAGASLLSFSLFLRSVLKFHSEGLR